MTTAATLLNETLIPAAKGAAAGIGAPGQIGAFGPSLFMSPFASLLAEGSFVQAPGTVPAENSGEASLAALFSMAEPGSMGGIGAALDGRDVPADPAFNVIALFDSTSISTPALVTPIPGPGLGVTAQFSDGATSDGSSVTPLGDIFAAPTGDSIVAPAAGQAAKPIPAAPTDSPQTSPARTPGSALAETGGPNEAHAPSPQPALKGVTAADVAAEIAQIDPQEPRSTGDAVEAPPINPAPINPGGQINAGGALESSAAPLTTAAPTALSLISRAAGAAASSTSDGQAAREGEAPDPRVTSQVVQSGAVRPPSQARTTTQTATERATVGKAAAKPATGLQAALSGDVALAAMAVETPKPSVIRPAALRTPAFGRGASGTTASPSAEVNGMPSSPQPSLPQSSLPQSSLPQPSLPGQTPSVTGQGNPPPATPGQAFDSASLGGGPRVPAAEVSDQPAAPRGAIDARMDTPHPAPQPMRAGEAVAQPDRPMAAPPPPAPPVPPAEQVALQLRHAVAKGVDKITIQLSPASLGAIDVTLEVSSGARVVVQVVAERADTLDLLRSDARGLERALQEAGLRTDSGSLNFNLRGGGDGASHQNSSARNGFDETARAADPETGGDTDADGESDGSPTRQASSQMLDIEV